MVWNGFHNCFDHKLSGIPWQAPGQIHPSESWHHEWWLWVLGMAGQLSGCLHCPGTWWSPRAYLEAPGLHNWSLLAWRGRLRPQVLWSPPPGVPRLQFPNQLSVLAEVSFDCREGVPVVQVAPQASLAVERRLLKPGQGTTNVFHWLCRSLPG